MPAASEPNLAGAMGSAAAGAVAVAAASADVTTRDDLDGRRQRLTDADICTRHAGTASRFAHREES